MTRYDLLKHVAWEFGVDMKQLLGPRRTRDVAWPRQAAYWLLRTHFGCSFPRVAQLTHRGDHTTVMSGIKSARRKLRYPRDLEEEQFRQRLLRLNDLVLANQGKLAA